MPYLEQPVTRDPAIRDQPWSTRWTYVAYLECRKAGVAVTLDQLVDEANLPERWVASAVKDLVRANRIDAVDTALVEAVDSPPAGSGGTYGGGKPPRERGSFGPKKLLVSDQSSTEALPTSEAVSTSPKGNGQLVVGDDRLNSAAPPKNPHFLLIDALIEAFNASTPSAKKACAVSAAELKQAAPPVKADEVPRLLEAWRTLFPYAVCTVSALPKHLGMLRQAKLRTPRAVKRESVREELMSLLEEDR